METTEETSHRRGGIYNYFEGATIHNLVINGNMSLYGRCNSTSHYGSERRKETTM